VTFGPGSGEDSLQTVLDKITVNPATGTDPGGIYNSSVNTSTDALLDTWDSYWSISGTGQSAASMIIELSGWSANNAFGIFDATDPSKSVQIFSGAASPGVTKGGVANIIITVDGDVYINYVDTGVNFAKNLLGFYLDTPNGRWYSDTGLNSDSVDHMYAYQGKGLDTVKIADLMPGLWTKSEFILGWEDISGGGDGDYQDFVVMVESVNPVPTPAAILLGILGLGVAGWRLRRFA